MAAQPGQGPSAPDGPRALSVEEARFYASVYGSARKGSLGELRRTGCSGEEAEEFFAEAFGKVMETVNPIEREFSAAQMVNFIKRAAWRCMIDERRRRGQRPEVEIGSIRSLGDTSAESPEEVAEEREAVAIGREALQMLSERDRLIFRQRHQMDLSPDEILQNMPGLSLRTYRKVIQRANTRVLDAFERIEGGERCQEMESRLLQRYVADESSKEERLAVNAHLAHCRACRRAQARMRGYLIDVSGTLIASSSLAGLSRFEGLRGIPTRLAEIASSGTQGLLEASRAARERLRETLLRLAGGLPGSGGDATVGQALTATSVKVVSACAASVAAGACVAAGVVPGVGGIGVLSQQDGRDAPSERGAVRSAPAPERSSLIDSLPAPSSPAPVRERSGRVSRQGVTARRESSASTPNSTSSQSAQSSPSSAIESGSVTGGEFGAESGQPVSPPATSPAPSSGGNAPSGQGGSSQDSVGSEFGL